VLLRQAYDISELEKEYSLRILLSGFHFSPCFFVRNNCNRSGGKIWGGKMLCATTYFQKNLTVERIYAIMYDRVCVLFYTVNIVLSFFL